MPKNISLNSDKSKLLITCKGRYRKIAESIKLCTINYNILPSTKIKVLGVIITNSLDNQAQINHIIQKVNYRISLLRGVFKYASFRTKKSSLQVLFYQQS